jgi:hypothetical protein
MNRALRSERKVKACCRCETACESACEIGLRNDWRNGPVSHDSQETLSRSADIGVRLMQVLITLAEGRSHQLQPPAESRRPLLSFASSSPSTALCSRASVFTSVSYQIEEK